MTEVNIQELFSTIGEQAIEIRVLRQRVRDLVQEFQRREQDERPVLTDEDALADLEDRPRPTPSDLGEPV